MVLSWAPIKMCFGLLFVFGFSVIQFSLIASLLAALNGIASGGEVATTKKSTWKFSSLQIGIYVWIGILITHLPISILLGEPQIGVAGLVIQIIGFRFYDGRPQPDPCNPMCDDLANQITSNDLGVPFKKSCGKRKCVRF